MTKKEAKQLIKEDGLYGAIHTLSDWRDDNLEEIIKRVLDEIPSDILKKAERKVCRQYGRIQN